MELQDDIQTQLVYQVLETYYTSIIATYMVEHVNLEQSWDTTSS